LRNVATIGGIAGVISALTGISGVDAINIIRGSISPGGQPSGPGGPSGQPAGPSVPGQPTGNPNLEHGLPAYNTQSLGLVRQDLQKIVKIPVDSVPEQVDDQVTWHSFNFVPNGYSNGGVENNDLYRAAHQIDKNRYGRTYGFRTPDTIPVNLNSIPHRPVFYPTYQNNQPFRDCFDDRPFQQNMMIDTIPKNSAYQHQIIVDTSPIYYPNLVQFEFNLARK
jgi:hypothetical protein